MNRTSSLLLLLALAGCGAYPQPFAGNPGRMGARLALPPPPRLVVSPPAEALLTNLDAGLFAQDVADALSDKEVPAVTTAARGADWRLVITAELHDVPGKGAQVIPTYTVRNPKGVSQGSTTGAPVTADTWSRSNAVALRLVAVRDAPAITQLLNSIEAAVQLSDPNSLVNRPPRIVLTGVTGAPGDGNTALATAIATDISNLGIVVQRTPDGADYQVAGKVTLTPSLPGQSRVEIEWIVTDPYGHEAGHLSQINDVPKGSLDHYWSDVAQVVAQEAAGGVREVIVNQTQGHRIGSTKARPGAPPLDQAGGSTPRPAS